MYGPKHTGGLHPIPNCKQFNHYVEIPTLKMQEVWQLIQQGDYAFSVYHKDTYLHIADVEYHCQFLQLAWEKKHYQWKVLPFRSATLPRVFTSLTMSILVIY